MQNRVSCDRSIEQAALGPAPRGPARAVGALVLLFSFGTALADTPPPAGEARPPDAAERLASSLADPALRALVLDALSRNPALAGAEARARASEMRVEQDQALPDPVLGVTGYLAPPETRVGPQRLIVTLSQRFPWFGTRELREQAALQGAEALAIGVEGRRLELVTEVRRLVHEVAFLDTLRRVVETDRETLLHYEELARTRYASGEGTQQGVVKIQAEISKDDSRLLDIATRRAALAASLNALRDRPQGTAVPSLSLPDVVANPENALDLAALRSRAEAARPELEQAQAEIAQAESRIELASRDFKPDFTLGVTYGAVSSRPEMGGLVLPPDNGKDIFGINLSVNLPLQRKRRHAGLEEATEARRAALARQREVVSAIDRDLGELVERLRLSGEQVRLFDRVLVVQAEQSLRAAEAAYASGRSGSLDLLDAERVLLEVRTGAARARADHAVALARLEGAVGASIDAVVEAETEGGER